MRLDHVIRADRVVLGDAELPCALGIADGRIAVVADRNAPLEASAEVVLAAGEVLLPGLVDTHVHVNEPGRTEWEGFETATQAAAAGGVTTIVDMPLNSVPPTTTVDALDLKRHAAARQAHVDIAFWGGAVPGNLDDIAKLHDAGVYGFKCFLIDSGVAEFPPLNEHEFKAAMSETARLGALLIVHAEDAETIASAPAPAGADYASFLNSRPQSAEVRAVAQVIEAARATGGRAHVLHLSSADALEQIHAARAAGIDLSVETCPHYLTLDADTVPAGATQYKCCPPIRERTNQQRLWAGLRSGDIDFIVSDHSPCTADLKDTEDFGAAWGGIASLQLGLPVIWSAARERGHTLVDVARWMATNPADRVGLAQKGRIAVGADADLCVFDPDAEFVVDAEQLRHRNQICPYDGRSLSGVVRQTWLRGVRIDPDGPRRGRLLRRGQR